MAKKVQKFNLSHHTLEINTRKCNYEKFDFSEIEEYVRALVGSREYQYDAIKSILIYLWGGSYKDITQLAKENWKTRPAIQERFQSEDHFLRQLPLPDRVSGVVHMATGTGKSYVIFAVAFISLILGKVKRVLILGPASTVIEAGLTGKFKEYLFGEKGLELKKYLPIKYQNIHINLLNENNPIEDSSIVIENINSIYNRDKNSIGDTLFKGTDEVLVLSDEVHHAYSHLTYKANGIDIDGEGGTGITRDERLWMKFLREEKKIKCHIGFTGTPYNKDEYFSDVIYNYSIKDALSDKFIKKIDPIIKTESDEGDVKLTTTQKFEQILITHERNKTKYSYKNSQGKPRLKPITIFIDEKQKDAETHKNEFLQVLINIYSNSKEYSELSQLEITKMASEKAICVISKPTDNDYQEKLNAIEELDPDKVGGKVEFVFAVNKLSEGWDVDNVFQIVPMEERVFNSKLLISQVLGRGLRIPRNIPQSLILQNYPIVTITNHQKFAAHIIELVDAVTLCDTRFSSEIFLNEENERYKYNFKLYNIKYDPITKIVDTEKTYPQNRELLLTYSREKLGLKVVYLSGEKKFELNRNFYTVDQVVAEINQRFSIIKYENKNFDFSNESEFENLPSYEDIEKIILNAMKNACIEGRKLSEQNKKAIDLYFNQYLPRGNKKRIITKVEGEITPCITYEMPTSSVRSGEVLNHKSVFISEDYIIELKEDNLFVLNDLEKRVSKMGDQMTFDSLDLIPYKDIRQLLKQYRIYVVNTSMFKTPQNLVVVSHNPERDFLFRMIKYSKYINSWTKSRDMNFYSIDYEYWKGGKDRVGGSFNPDFFIKIDLEAYLTKLDKMNVDSLNQLLNQGIKEIILVVEIKSDDDQEEVTRAKERAGIDHFKALNRQLLNERENNTQFYIFELLRPEFYNNWFQNLQEGQIKIESFLY